VNGDMTPPAHDGQTPDQHEQEQAYIAGQIQEFQRIIHAAEEGIDKLLALSKNRYESLARRFLEKQGKLYDAAYNLQKQRLLDTRNFLERYQYKSIDGLSISDINTYFCRHAPIGPPVWGKQLHVFDENHGAEKAVLDLMKGFSKDQTHTE